MMMNGNTGIGQFQPILDQEQGSPDSNQNGNSVSAFLRGNPMLGMGMMQNTGMGMGMGNSSNPMAAAMMNNNGSNMNAMNNFSFNDLKRLQHLQQQIQSNTPIMPQAPPQQDPSSAILQSYLDQKVQSSRFDDSLRNQFGMGGLQGMGNPNQMLSSNLFPDHLMMNQCNMNGVMKPSSNDLPLPSPHSLFHRDGSRRMRGGVIEPFPEKLHRLLLEVEAAGRGDVISFVANGRAFAIHKPDNFFKEIVPLYFRQSRLSSFKRQLNLYGFELINTGPARGGYYHELFVKERAELCRRMRRVAVKVGSKKKGGAGAKEEAGDAPINNLEKEAMKQTLKDLDLEQPTEVGSPPDELSAT